MNTGRLKMFLRKNGNSIILFIRGFIESDGELNVNNIHESAREEAHTFCRAIFHEAKDIERMRTVVDYYTDLYNRKRYAALKKDISDACSAMAGYVSLPNLRLASGDKSVLAAYECGFIYKVRHEMENIEMFASVGLDKDEIDRRMGYQKDLSEFEEEDDELLLLMEADYGEQEDKSDEPGEAEEEQDAPEDDQDGVGDVQDGPETEGKVQDDSADMSDNADIGFLYE